MTPEDVLELPRMPGIGGYELLDGRPVPVIPPSRVQRRLITTATYVIENYVRENRLRGEVQRKPRFVLRLEHDPQRLYVPDVAYIEHLEVQANPDPNRLIRCAPDLAFEVDVDLIDAFVRPGMVRKAGGRRRLTDYLEAGARLVWAIDSHARTAMVHRPHGPTQLVREDEMLDGEDVLPGFQLLLADLFDL